MSRDGRVWDEIPIRLPNNTECGARAWVGALQQMKSVFYAAASRAMFRGRTR